MAWGGNLSAMDQAPTNNASRSCARSFTRFTARQQKPAQNNCNQRAPTTGRWRALSPRSQPCTWKWATGPEWPWGPIWGLALKANP